MWSIGKVVVRNQEGRQQLQGRRADQERWLKISMNWEGGPAHCRQAYPLGLTCSQLES